MFNFYVQLDPALKVYVGLGVTFIFSFLLLQLAAVFPALAEYLGQYKAGIVTWLTGIAVQLIQAQLDHIPANWDGVVYAAMKLFVEVLLVLLGFSALRKIKAKGYQALQ